MALARTLFGHISTSVPSLLAALGSAALALLWLEVSWVGAAAVAVALIAFGLLSYWIGDKKLDRDTPEAVSAARWLRWSIAAHIGLAAFAGAAILVVAIDTAPKDTWSEQRKQLTAAFVGAFTTYLTTVFVKGADEADEGWVGAIVKDRFTKRLANRFPVTEIAVRNAAFDLTRGWDADERMARAEEIDAYIDGGGTVLARS